VQPFKRCAWQHLLKHNSTDWIFCFQERQLQQSQSTDALQYSQAAYAYRIAKGAM
jgi:hypothetical protein